MKLSDDGYASAMKIVEALYVKLSDLAGKLTNSDKSCVSGPGSLQKLFN